MKNNLLELIKGIYEEFRFSFSGITYNTVNHIFYGSGIITQYLKKYLCDEQRFIYYDKINSFITSNQKYNHYLRTDSNGPKRYRIPKLTLLVQIYTSFTNYIDKYNLNSFLYSIIEKKYELKNKLYSEKVKEDLFKNSYITYEKTIRVIAKSIDTMIETMPRDYKINVLDYLTIILGLEKESPFQIRGFSRRELSKYVSVIFSTTTKTDYKDSLFSLVKFEVQEKIRKGKLVYTKGILEKKY